MAEPHTLRQAAPPEGVRDPKPRPQNLQGLDGLRGVGSLCVVVGHVVGSTWTVEAFDAVSEAALLTKPFGEALTMFFVLSGFLIFLPFAAAFAQDRRMPRTRRYLLARFLRVYPGYVVILLLVNFVLATANVGNMRELKGEALFGTITDPGTLLADLLLVHTLIPGTLSTGVLPSWSLTVELGFYLLVPLLALGMVWIARRRGVPRGLAFALPGLLLVVVGLATRGWLTARFAGVGPEQLADLNWGVNATAVLARSTLAQADLFGYGMLAAAFFAATAGAAPAWWTRRTRIALYAVVGLLAAVSIVLIYRNVPAAPTLCVGVGTALLILLMSDASRRGTAGRNPLIRVLEWAPIRWFGTISLSVYLWHMPVMHWLRLRGFAVESYPSLAAALSLTLAITIALSVVTYHLVERPALSLKGGELGTAGRAVLAAVRRAARWASAPRRRALPAVPDRLPGGSA